LPKKSFAKSTLPSGVRGRFCRSSVETRNSSPAPSASEAVMMGVWIHRNPFSWKKRWIAWANVFLTRVIAPITLVRGRRCATSRRNSMVWGLGWIGYVSGSSTQPMTFSSVACISKGWPFAGEGTMVPVASTAQPAVSLWTSEA
jgi:hypothetical protein